MVEKEQLDNKIGEIVKVLLSYCHARTSNQWEAEELAQDIILALYQSVGSLRDEHAFYGFMWAVAGNVYKGWCKKRTKQRECELPDTLPFEEDFAAEEDSQLYLLRRELSLLSEKYRKAVILYYIENQSCAQISRALSVSESMVKYLLFKSRRILKEGMSMERNYGSQSYNPKELSLQFWGKSISPCCHLCDSRISQNILFACYNDRLTAEQISLEIGVALPYMEDRLEELYQHELLKKDGNRYYTNIIIFTEDFINEVSVKTAALCERIADIVQQTVDEQKEEVCRLGFDWVKHHNQTYQWQMSAFLLYLALMDKLQNRVQIVYPKDKEGAECFVWGKEKSRTNDRLSAFTFGVSTVESERGDRVQFMDFLLNGEMVHFDFFGHQNTTNVFLDIARGEYQHFGENDRAIAAELVRKGYVLSTASGLSINAPVWTAVQQQRLKEIFSAAAEQIAQEAEAMMDVVTKILKSHVPVHLKKQANDLAFLRLFEDAISAPVAVLCERKYLLPYTGDGMLPTTYVVLSESDQA